MLVDVNIGLKLHGSVAAAAALISRDGNKAGRLTSHSDDALALVPASSFEKYGILIFDFFREMKIFISCSGKNIVAY